jgi:geranylgeranyl pyrophosphate synthase
VAAIGFAGFVGVFRQHCFDFSHISMPHAVQLLMLDEGTAFDLLDDLLCAIGQRQSVGKPFIADGESPRHGTLASALRTFNHRHRVDLAPG